MNGYYFCGLLVISVGVIAYGRTLFKYYSFDKLPDFINTEELGQIEGQIGYLQQVIIIAHLIEIPTGSLFNAVKKNLENGVEYIFFVSKSKYNKQDKNYKIFEALANSINANKQLITMCSLNFEW